MSGWNGKGVAYDVIYEAPMFIQGLHTRHVLGCDMPPTLLTHVRFVGASFLHFIIFFIFNFGHTPTLRIIMSSSPACFWDMVYIKL